MNFNESKGENSTFISDCVNSKSVLFPNQNDRIFFDKYIRNHDIITIDGVDDFKQLDFALMVEYEISVGIDQFLFDGSFKDNQSINKKEFSVFYRHFVNTANNLTCTHSDGKQFSYQFSLENYLDSFIYGFDKHYKMINAYKQTLVDYSQRHKKQLKTDYIGFLIVEDSIIQLSLIIMTVIFVYLRFL
ncbi:MAG: hypothetical protein RBQ97_09725 [Acholeplasma sp.]|nr:hypothetical protein [Acholeplasma sp.]